MSPLCVLHVLFRNNFNKFTVILSIFWWISRNLLTNFEKFHDFDCSFFNFVIIFLSREFNYAFGFWLAPITIPFIVQFQHSPSCIAQYIAISNPSQAISHSFTDNVSTPPIPTNATHFFYKNTIVSAKGILRNALESYSNSNTHWIWHLPKHRSLPPFKSKLVE